MATKPTAKPAAAPEPSNDTPGAAPEQLVATPELNPRNAVLAALAKSSDMERPDRDGGPVGAYEPGPEDPEYVAPTDAGTPDAKPPTPEELAKLVEEGKMTVDGDPIEPTNDSDTPPTPGPATRKIIVDGVEIEVPIEKVLDRGVATMQKETAADERLKAAEKLYTEALAFANRTVAQAQGQQPDQGQQPQMTQAEYAAELARRIQFGTPQEGAAAVQELIGMASGVQGNILSQVTQVVDQRTAAQQFASEFKDLVGDPYAMKLVFARERELRAEAADQGQAIGPFNEFYKRIGDEVRSYRTGLMQSGSQAAPNPIPTPAPTPRGAQPATTQGRVAAKAAAPKAVTGASALPTQNTAPKPKTTAEAITDMARARGQRLFGSKSF
jgi:hypothetical protein